MTIAERIKYAQGVVELAETNVQLAREKCPAFLSIVENDLLEARVRLGVLLAEHDCKQWAAARHTTRQLGIQRVAMSIFGEGLRAPVRRQD